MVVAGKGTLSMMMATVTSARSQVMQKEKEKRVAQEARAVTAASCVAVVKLVTSARVLVAVKVAK
jgi:hypothetical protein